MAGGSVKASVVVVNWNGREHLTDCLESLALQSFRDFEVVLVDNGSRDGSQELVRECYPWVRLVELPRNTGFATGNNRGFQEARGEYLVALNNDTRVEPDWLEALVGVAEAHPKAGMVGCRICSFYDHDLIDSLGMGICRDGMSRGLYRNRRYSELELPEVVEILFPSACAALYRRRMLEETGFFDDDFFAYAEDSDLGLRGRVAGWDALLATRAVVYHKYSQTGGAFSPFKLYLVERNHYWAVLKSFPASRIAAVPLFTAARYLEQLRGALGGKGSGGEFMTSGSRGALVGALLRGMAHALLGIPAVLRKRRKIMKQRKITSTEMARLLRRHRISAKELLGHE